jgi:hypothetical protein
MSDKSRGESAKLTKTQRRQLLLTLKVRALDGDMQAAHALSNFELAEVTRNRLYRDMDGVQVA